jgi:hypothetical protein
MAEGNMNPNTQEQMMLVQSFEQLANAVDADLPMAVQSEIAAVKEGKRMSEELQRMLAEGSMSFMNQLNPEMMQDTGMMDTGSAVREGEAAMGMAGPGMMPSRDEMTYGPSSGITVEPNVMSMEEAIEAGMVTPTRPRMRPAAPATSMRPRMRP